MGRKSSAKQGGRSPWQTRRHEQGPGRPWWQVLLAVSGLALLAAAVLRELRQPSAERTWTGKLGGVMPYNLRPPTAQRLRDTFWNPENPDVFRPKAFGVGWDVNFAALARTRRRLAATRHVDPANEADVRDVIDATRRQNPQASFDDILAAWRVRRGVEIDDAEVEQVRAVDDRLNVADVP